MKIGIFDSGIGGEAVAQSLQQAFPDATIVTVNDREHLPYGDRTAQDVTQLTDSAIQPLLEQSCDVIVLACNTATAAAIETLRERYPDQPFIGLEPMVKPASELTKTGVIGVCATPATLASERYKSLKHRFAGEGIVIEPDCSGWAQMIEHDQIDELIVKNIISDICEQGADVIVLACTHYHWIRDVIEKTAAGRATVLDPSDAIVKRVKALITK